MDRPFFPCLLAKYLSEAFQALNLLVILPSFDFAYIFFTTGFYKISKMYLLYRKQGYNDECRCTYIALPLAQWSTKGIKHSYVLGDISSRDKTDTVLADWLCEIWCIYDNLTGFFLIPKITEPE